MGIIYKFQLFLNITSLYWKKKTENTINMMNN